MFQEATAHLSSVDPVMGKLIENYGACRLQRRSEGSDFSYLARIIISQQLSTKAARTIHDRFLALFGDKELTPVEVLKLPDEALRGVGISKQKTRFIKDLARKSHVGELPIDDLPELEDEDLIRALTLVKGVGRWSAKMFLMFRLGRPNVLPENDLSIQKAIMLAYGLERMPTPKQVLEIGARWSPYSSTASWYLYRTLD